MKGSCIFCCSSCISFNPTSHLKSITIKESDEAEKLEINFDKALIFNKKHIQKLCRTANCKHNVLRRIRKYL